MGSPAGRRRGRVDRVTGRERAGPGRGRDHRDRHPVQRFHHRVHDRVPEPGRPVREPQRHALDAAKNSGVMLVADAREGLEALTRRWPATTSTRRTPRHTEHQARWNKVVDEAYHLDHGPLPAQTEVLGALNESDRAERRPSCRPPGRCRVTCRCFGAPRIPSSTTSSTPSPAWGTRSPAHWGSRWPPRSARSTPWSATARI